MNDGPVNESPLPNSVFAAVEAGGTKFRAALVSGSFEIIDEAWIPTTQPDETLKEVIAFFSERRQASALGIASFGPLIVDPASPNYGSLAETPKPGWSQFGLFAGLQEGLGIPSAIQTDVEAAAVAEHQLGAGRGHSSVGYVTVGTGIGAAVAIDGVPFRGRDHTELGHIPVRRVDGDDFEGICPFHGDCLEGMASGPSIAKRWDCDPAQLDGRDDVWDLEAKYLAQLVRVYAYSFAPDIVLFGGGVGARQDMAQRVQNSLAADMAGYSVSHSNNKNLVRRAGLGANAGLVGAALSAAELVPG